MYWLAINREPIAIADLQADLLSFILPAQLLVAIGAVTGISGAQKLTLKALGAI